MEERNRTYPLLFRFLYVILLLMLMTPSLSLNASAAGTDAETDIQQLEAGETLDGPGFFSGDMVQIDGTVNGTTFASATTVQINGTINGSLFVAGQTVILNGTVTGNIYGAGQTLTVSGQYEGDVFFTGATLQVNPETEMGRDLFFAGMTLIQSGSLSRHLFGVGQQVTLNGSIGGDANLEAERLALNESALIEGDLLYGSQNEATINPNASINGQTDWQRRDQQMRPLINRGERWGFRLIWMVGSILAALLVWLLFKKDFWLQAASRIASSPLKTMGVGLLALLVTPLLALLAFITIIGIPVGLILLALYAICLYVSKIVVAVFIGSWLADRFHWDNVRRQIWLVLLGLVMIHVLGWIPFIGFIFSLLVLITGLGALVYSNTRPDVPTSTSIS